MVPPAPTPAKMITRSKRGMEHHPSSSHLSGSSTASTMNRKPSASTMALSSAPVSEASARTTTATKSSMPPPVSIPPPRTLTKPSTSSIVTAAKDAARPKKKLAKEGVVPPPVGVSVGRAGAGDAVPSPNSSTATPVRTPLATSRQNSRGNSTSPLQMSPSGFDRGSYLRIPIPKAPKKQELAAGPIKSRILAGTTQRRLREPTPRSSRSDNVPPKTPHNQSASGSQSRSKGPSKSGVDTNSENIPSIELRSEPGQIPAVVSAAKPIPECLPQIIPDRIPELELQIQDLTTNSSNLTSRLEDVVRENCDLIQQNGQLLEDKQNLERVNDTLQQEKLALEDRYALAVQQLQAASQLNSALQTELSQWPLTHQAVLDTNQATEEELARLRSEITVISERVLSLETENRSLVSEKGAVAGQVAELEKSCLKAREELDAVRKEMCALKKKHQTENTRAVEQVAALQKQLQDKEREAESWKTVTELKQCDVKKMQSELEVAKIVVDRHSLCERELSAQLMKIEDLETTIENITTNEKKWRTAVKEKDQELNDLRRRSMIILQEKDTLKYQLDRVSENDDAEDSFNC